ncbi:hypothetical protein E2320_022128, partial [Naja naja]
MTGLPLLLLLFWLLPPTSAKRMQTICALTRSLQILEDYYRPGDLIIGGNLPLAIIFLSFNSLRFHKDPFQQLLSILGVGFEFSQGERRVYPSFFRINPKEFPQYVGLLQLLLYFQWNWVGLVAPESDNGERFISSLMPMLKEKEICLAFTEKLKLDFLVSTKLKFLHIFKIWSKAEVIILFGDSNSIINILAIMNVHKQWTKATFCKVWILTSHWKVSMMGSQDILKGINPFHGALHFRDHTGDISGFSHFLLSLDPLNPQGDLKFLHIFKIWSKTEVIILFGDSSSITNILAVMNVHEQWTKATFCK